MKNVQTTNYKLPTTNYKNNSASKKVVVAMSGGVDSSVAAAILVGQGYDVIGVFLKFWQEPDNVNKSENICCSTEAADSARRVAEKLKIPFYVLDATKEFKKMVVDYYINEYDAGRTPNPCVVCNKFIKFGWLIEKAKKLGASYIATGHYARLKKIITKSLKLKTASQNLKLLKAKDKKKDQSYFLWQLSQNQLKYIIFPIGDYKKDEVRKLAKRFNLPTASRKESQNVCFVPEGKNPDFLSRYIKKLSIPGNIVDSSGNILGRHKGLAYFTIGQRHGIDGIQLKLITNNEKLKTAGFLPAYVIKLNVEKNELIVGNENEIYQKKLIAEKVHFIDKASDKSTQITAKIRYGHKNEKCQIVKLLNCSKNNSMMKQCSNAEIIFDKAQRAITPGQSIVFYNKDELVGGGVIK